MKAWIFACIGIAAGFALATFMMAPFSASDNHALLQCERDLSAAQQERDECAGDHFALINQQMSCDQDRQDLRYELTWCLNPTGGSAD